MALCQLILCSGSFLQQVIVGAPATSFPPQRRYLDTRFRHCQATLGSGRMARFEWTDNDNLFSHAAGDLAAGRDCLF